MSFIRRIKKGNNVYLAKVESFREDGKVKQRVIEYIGKEEDGNIIPKKTKQLDFNISKVTQYLDILTVDTVSKTLEINELFGKSSKYLLALIYSHLIKKVSVYKLPEWAEQTEIANILNLKKITTKDLYTVIEKFSEIDFEIFEKMLSEKFRVLEDDNRIAVLDVTDTYFNGKDADWKSRRGKDGKYDKLIQIALAVTFKNGFPILHKTYEGNISNINIFVDMINNLKIYGYDAIIVDRGFSSQSNINNLHEYGLKGIMGIRLSSKIANGYLSKINRDEIFTKQSQLELKNTKVYIKGFDYQGGRLVAIFNPAIEISQREKYFDKTENIRVNKYFGYSLIYHNLSISDKDAVSKYFDKDIVERSFKKVKGAISLHPLQACKLENIKSHIKICYLAYAILSYLEFKVKPIGISASEALKLLQGAYKIQIEFEDKRNIEKVVMLKKIQQLIIDAVGVVYKT